MPSPMLAGCHAAPTASDAHVCDAHTCRCGVGARALFFFGSSERGRGSLGEGKGGLWVIYGGGGDVPAWLKRG